MLPRFLTASGVKNVLVTVFKDPKRVLFFFIMVAPPFINLDIHKVIFSYLFCGVSQGLINTALYSICDRCFFGKEIDIKQWSQTKMYKDVVFNTDATYIYVLGGFAYISVQFLPEPIRWSFDYPGYKNCLLQLLLIAIMHDIFFTIVHIVVHKVSFWRESHIKLHHDCPFEVGNSRCAIAAEAEEALVRDLLTALVPTYIVGALCSNFYGYLWVLYYSVYTFWAMYVHTGVNRYHALHHGIKPHRNYGLYYITDFFIGTLDLKP
jgi:sterol desaturase/sphingolipid hydroxylase (fatty acid hydroxylase superfamily)